MTTEQIEIVKENFNQIAPLADLVAAEFYERLFALDASLRPLFKEDLTEQKKHLMMMLKFAVGTLDRMDVFEPSLEELGRKHVAYGVKQTHYETVGNALILTLRAMLGASLTEKLEAAWIAAYTLIAGTMQRAAYQTQGASRRIIAEVTNRTISNRIGFNHLSLSRKLWIELQQICGNWTIWTLPLRAVRFKDHPGATRCPALNKGSLNRHWNSARC